MLLWIKVKECFCIAWSNWVSLIFTLCVSTRINRLSYSVTGKSYWDIDYLIEEPTSDGIEQIYWSPNQILIINSRWEETRYAELENEKKDMKIIVKSFFFIDHIKSMWHFWIVFIHSVYRFSRLLRTSIWIGYIPLKVHIKSWIFLCLWVK